MYYVVLRGWLLWSSSAASSFCCLVLLSRWWSVPERHGLCTRAAEQGKVDTCVPRRCSLIRNVPLKWCCTTGPVQGKNKTVPTKHWSAGSSHFQRQQDWHYASTLGLSMCTGVRIISTKTAPQKFAMMSCIWHGRSYAIWAVQSYDNNATEALTEHT